MLCGCNVQPFKAAAYNRKTYFLLNFDFAVFEPYKDSRVDLLGPKLLFIALNLGGLALGVWKVRFFSFHFKHVWFS